MTTRTSIRILRFCTIDNKQHMNLVASEKKFRSSTLFFGHFLERLEAESRHENISEMWLGKNRENYCGLEIYCNLR